MVSPPATSVGVGSGVGVEVDVSAGTRVGVIVGTGVAVATGAGRACPESIERVEVGVTVDVGGDVTVGVDVCVGVTVSVGGSKVGDAQPAASRLTNPTSTHLVAFIVPPLHTLDTFLVTPSCRRQGIRQQSLETVEGDGMELHLQARPIEQF